MSKEQGGEPIPGFPETINASQPPSGLVRQQNFLLGFLVFGPLKDLPTIREQRRGDSLRDFYNRSGIVGRGNL